MSKLYEFFQKLVKQRRLFGLLVLTLPLQACDDVKKFAAANFIYAESTDHKEINAEVSKAYAAAQREGSLAKINLVTSHGDPLICRKASVVFDS